MITSFMIHPTLFYDPCLALTTQANVIIHFNLAERNIQPKKHPTYTQALKSLLFMFKRHIQVIS